MYIENTCYRLNVGTWTILMESVLKFVELQTPLTTANGDGGQAWTPRSLYFILISWHLSTKPSGFYELHLPCLRTFLVPLRSLDSWFNLSPYEIILTFMYKIQMNSMRLKPLHQLIPYDRRQYLPSVAFSCSIVFEMHWSLQSSSDVGMLRQIGNVPWCSLHQGTR